jgi:fluoride exporter
MDTLFTCLILALGGALGTVARYGLSMWAMPISQHLPWGTLLVNMLGALLIGFFGTLTLSDGKYPVSEQVRLFMMVGVCGGFTTFSAFSLQTLDLLRSGAWMRAILNILLSVGFCVGAVAVGHLAAAFLNEGAIRIAQTEIEEEG